MAYPIPSTVPLIPPYQLIAPKAAKEPLHSILGATNRLYQRFCPALLSLAPIHASTPTDVHTWEVPLPVSADGLDYTVEVHTWRASTGGNVTVSLDTSTTVTTGTPWTALDTENVDHSSDNHVDHSYEVTPPTGTKYLRISVDGNSSNCQLQHILVYPSMPQTLPSAVTSSGFTPWEDGLLSAAGGAINTEQINRVHANVKAILLDRRQCAASFSQPTNYTAPHRVGVGLGGGEYAVQQLLRGPLWIPYQSSPLVRVRARALLSGGATAGTIRVRSGSGVASLDADGGDHEAVMPYVGQDLGVTIITPPERIITLVYLTLDFAPGDSP